MTLAAVSTALSISINLLVIVLVVISLLIILVVMMQRPKQEGLGAAFGGGMTDQLLGAGTTSFLQKATVILGILFFVLSLILGILVGRSNKEKGLDVKTAVASEESAAPAPDIADGIDLSEDEDEILKAIEAASQGTNTEDKPEMDDEAAVPELIVPETIPEEVSPTEATPVEEILEEITDSVAVEAESEPAESEPAESVEEQSDDAPEAPDGE